MRKIFYFVLLGACMVGSTFLASCSDDDESVVPDYIDYAENQIKENNPFYINIHYGEAFTRGMLYMGIDRPFVCMKTDAGDPAYLDLNSISVFDAPDEYVYPYNGTHYILGNTEYNHEWDVRKAEAIINKIFFNNLPDYVRIRYYRDSELRAARKVLGVTSGHYLAIGEPLDANLSYDPLRKDSIDLRKVVFMTQMQAEKDMPFITTWEMLACD